MAREVEALVAAVFKLVRLEPKWVADDDAIATVKTRANSGGWLCRVAADGAEDDADDEEEESGEIAR